MLFETIPENSLLPIVVRDRVVAIHREQWVCRRRQRTKLNMQIDKVALEDPPTTPLVGLLEARQKSPRRDNRGWKAFRLSSTSPGSY